MALERKDSRYKLDEDDHIRLKVFAEIDECTDGELTERVMSDYLRKRAHATKVAAAKLELAGINGIPGEKPGTHGRGR
jgi:hypothetical protein